MPFDFAKMRHYKIDYNEFFEEVNSQIIFKNQFIQKDYLHKWIRVLKDSDESITNSLSTKQSIIDLKILMDKEPEMFRLPIHYKNNTIYMQFRVSILKEWIKNLIDNYQEIELSEFKNGQIKWFPVELKKDFNLLNNDPIIMIPFRDNKYNFFVVDGNHRLSYKMLHKTDKIKAIIISEESISENKVFASAFDRYYYIFANEINRMANSTHLEKKDAHELLRTSFLTSGKFSSY